MNRIDEIKERLKNATPGPWYNLGDILKAEQALHPKHPKISKDWNIARFPHRTADYPISHLEYVSNKNLIAHAPTDIAYLLRIAEAAEVMREALEFYKLQGFFNSYDDKHKIHDYGERSIKALAKAKELMGE